FFSNRYRVKYTSAGEHCPANSATMSSAVCRPSIRGTTSEYKRPVRSCGSSPERRMTPSLPKADAVWYGLNAGRAITGTGYLLGGETSECVPAQSRGTGDFTEKPGARRWVPWWARIDNPVVRLVTNDLPLNWAMTIVRGSSEEEPGG